MIRHGPIRETQPTLAPAYADADSREGYGPQQGGRRADAELGYLSVGDYPATVPAMIDWLTSTAQLTEGAQSPAGFADDFFAGRFDYEREDAALAGRSRRDGVNL
jgi:hypothetical protein